MNQILLSESKTAPTKMDQILSSECKTAPHMQNKIKQNSKMQPQDKKK